MALTTNYELKLARPTREAFGRALVEVARRTRTWWAATPTCRSRR